MKFIDNGIEYYVDDIIHFHQVVGEPDYLVLDEDFHCMGDVIPKGTVWNGASSPNTPIARFIAPKYYRNIIASCWHDFKCGKAKNSRERLIADEGYFKLKKHVEEDNSIKCKASYLGTRIGAILGIGSSF